MDKSIGEQLAALVIKKIQNAYFQGKIVTTNDCVNDMTRDGLFEADVEKVIMGASVIEKAMPATSSLLASSPQNTHYVITGESTKCVKVYCKICSNYHPATDEFIGWRLTSFCIDTSKR